jgi:hypothetical protein
MAINVGYVIECDNPAYEGKAKVRIPALHGTPLIGSTFTNINNIYSKYIPASASTSNGAHKLSMQDYNINRFGKDDNIKVVTDENVPWYPIIYSFGSNIGPSLFDVVYVLDNSYIIGWANNTFMPTK